MNSASKFQSACLVLLALSLAACSGLKTPSTGGTGGSGGNTTGPYSIGGTVSGLTGAGNSFTLTDGTDTITVSANGNFTFKTALSSGTQYTVKVTSQPSNPSEACTVTNASGTASANVTNVNVTCSTGAFIVGGVVNGLQGSGLTIQDNGGDNLTINSPGGSFTFPTPVSGNSPTYNVTVLKQPTSPAQTCVVTNGTGTATSNVGNVSITCSAGTIHIGGSVAGFAGGTGFTLLDNGGDSLTISANGNFTFATLLPAGANYSVTVGSQPTGPAQVCTVTNGTGVANSDVTSVQVLCPAVFHTISGQVVGLVGTGGGLILQDNGGDNLPLDGNGAFTFPTPIANGSNFDVSVFVEPNTQPQIPRIYDYKGVANTDITNVVVDFGHNDWAWLEGSNSSDQYETNSPPSNPSNITTQVNSTPGGIRYPATWTDLNGNLWMFSGFGFTVTANGSLPGLFNDLWMYQSTQYDYGYEGSFYDYWTRVYPPQSPPNTPPTMPSGRDGAVTWTDPATGNLWLFGGESFGLMNDLWEYQIGNAAWIYHGGGSSLNGLYTGVNAYPGSRWGATARLDASGNVWMFGGFGFDATSSSPGLLNDLWEFNTTSHLWTFVSGSSTANQSGVYGTLGQAAPGNVPGGRQASSSWIDSAGNFWMFGGYDTDASGHQNDLNDLWEFSGGQWTWVSGSNSVNQLGVYGTQGVAAATNVPGARYSSAAFTDRSGNFWLFGGFGYDATGNGALSDLWEFKGGQWIWVKGPSSVGQKGIYGIQPNPTIWPEYTNNPGGRWAPGFWSAPNYNVPIPFAPYDQFYIMGGQGFDGGSGDGNGKLNDLWRYLPYP